MQEILEQLGYTKSQSAVYTALLEGTASAGILAKKTDLDRVSVYKALNKLLKQGLVSYIIQSNKKTFKAAHPDIIKDQIQQKKKQLAEFEKKMPSIIEKIKSNEEVQSEIYQGIKGLKTLTEKFLKQLNKGDEWLVLGAPRKAENLGGFYKDLNKRSAKKGVKLKIVYNKDANSLYQVRKDQALAQVRIMPENYITPAEIEIAKNSVAIILFSPTIIAFHIESKEIADSFRKYFQLIWQNSKTIQA